jgi:hypothetical protein
MILIVLTAWCMGRWEVPVTFTAALRIFCIVTSLTGDPPPTLLSYSLAYSPSFISIPLAHLPLPSRALHEFVAIPQPTFASPPPPISYPVQLLPKYRYRHLPTSHRPSLRDLEDCFPYLHQPLFSIFFAVFQFGTSGTTLISSSSVESVHHLRLERSERFGLTSTVQ